MQNYSYILVNKTNSDSYYGTNRGCSMTQDKYIVRENFIEDDAISNLENSGIFLFMVRKVSMAEQSCNTFKDAVTILNNGVLRKWYI